MVRDVLTGFLGFFSAFKDLKKYGLWKFVWISGGLCLLVGLLFFVVISQYYDDIGGSISAFYKWEKGKSLVTTITNIVSGALLTIGVILIFKYIILILVSPIMSLVSERVESHDKNIALKPGSFNLSALLRGLRLSFGNICRELGLTLFLLVLSLVPIAAIITGPAIFLVQAYFAGFGNMDYTMERYYNINESRSFVKKNKGIAIGNGIGYVLLLMIPIVGLFFAPTLATVSSTKAILKRQERMLDA